MNWEEWDNWEDEDEDSEENLFIRLLCEKQEEYFKEERERIEKLKETPLDPLSLFGPPLN